MPRRRSHPPRDSLPSPLKEASLLQACPIPILQFPCRLSVRLSESAEGLNEFQHDVIMPMLLHRFSRYPDVQFFTSCFRTQAAQLSRYWMPYFHSSHRCNLESRVGRIHECIRLKKSRVLFASAKAFLRLLRLVGCFDAKAASLFRIGALLRQRCTLFGRGVPKLSGS